VKNQRVRYYHKASGTWFDDAHVVGVHHDDGADRPYYTIRYRPDDDDDGAAATNGAGMMMEKQTTYDRLEPAEWDEDETGKILSRRKAL